MNAHALVFSINYLLDFKTDCLCVCKSSNKMSIISERNMVNFGYGSFGDLFPCFPKVLRGAWWENESVFSSVCVCTTTDAYVRWWEKKVWIRFRGWIHLGIRKVFCLLLLVLAHLFLLYNNYFLLCWKGCVSVCVCKWCAKRIIKWKCNANAGRHKEHEEQETNEKVLPLFLYRKSFGY